MTFFTSTAAELSLIFSGMFFLAGLLTGCWKYFAMINSEKKRAPYYVDIAHRASLMYSFSALIIAVFAQLSVFSETINVVAALLPLLFFMLAIMGYIAEGYKDQTRNMTGDNHRVPVMSALMVAEISGFVVLFVGFLLSL